MFRSSRMHVSTLLTFKWYMDMIMDIVHYRELDYIFAHADEAINSKMLITSWLNQDDYDKFIPLMGGFYTILVILKILFKKYGCLVFKDWWVDGGAIAFEGRHYARSVPLHRQSFEALVKNRMKSESVVREISLPTSGAIRVQEIWNHLWACLDSKTYVPHYCNLKRHKQK